MALRKHKHWSKPDEPVHGFPEVTVEQWERAPWCDLPTLTACDARHKAWVIETFGEKKTVSKDEKAKKGAVKGAEPKYTPAVED